MKILLVDDQRLFRSSLIRLLKSIYNTTYSYEEASNGVEALERLQNSNIDLVFLDISMPIMDGFEACRRMRSEHTKVAIIILTQFDNESLIFHFFNIGVHSFLSKGASVDQLKVAIESAITGTKYFPPEIGDIIQKKKSESNSNRVERIELTRQEKQLLHFLKEGLTSKEVAVRMSLTVKTVRTYKERLMEKTNTRNVAELIALGFRNGLLR